MVLGEDVAITLVLTEGVSRLGQRRGHMVGLVAAFAAMVVACDLAYLVLQLVEKRAPEALSWGLRVISLSANAVAITAARLAARRLSEAEDGGVAPWSQGAALRTLAWALIARIALAAVGQAVFIAAARSRSFDVAGTALVVTAALNVCASALLVVGLVGYHRPPERLRSAGAIRFAIAALALGVVLDLYGASSGSQLFRLLDEPFRARSFWGIPSMVKAASLQLALSIAAALALAAGVTAALALAGSLRRTAAAIGASDLATRAGTVRTLQVLVGLLAVGVSLAFGHLGKPVVLLAVAAVLVLAVALVVNWLVLLFGLARALDGAPT